MDKEALLKMTNTINDYLALMPKAHHYSICRQKETSRILEYVIATLEQTDPESKFLPTLRRDLTYVKKWDGVTEEPPDIEFSMLLDQIRHELKALKAVVPLSG